MTIRYYLYILLGYFIINVVIHDHYCIVDINECQSDYHGCSSDATCVNFHGGYFCRCNDGYHGNGRSCHGENKEVITLVAHYNNDFCRY